MSLKWGEWSTDHCNTTFPLSAEGTAAWLKAVSHYGMTMPLDDAYAFAAAVGPITLSRMASGWRCRWTPSRKQFQKFCDFFESSDKASTVFIFESRRRIITYMMMRRRQLEIFLRSAHAERKKKPYAALLTFLMIWVRHECCPERTIWTHPWIGRREILWAPSQLIFRAPERRSEKISQVILW